MKQIKGYKVFNSDWTCRGFQYEVGKTYEMEEELVLCTSGFHFCERAVDCFNHYNFNPENKVAEVVAHGKTVKNDDKSCTNKIEIVREIPWEELLIIVNTGKGNTGLANSGGSNSGNWNSGNWNSGNCNSGDWNSGNWNSGDNNSGNCNSGDNNSGNWNSGNWNSGNWNSGNWNSGNCNSGNWNSGNWNSGNWNSGNNNSGNWNSGNWNSGNWNLSNNNSGCFCTETHNVLFFDEKSNLTIEDWRNSPACNLLLNVENSLLSWICDDNMSEQEKAAHPEYKTTGGYLRKNDTSKAYGNWWKRLSRSEKQIIFEIPNFDAEKFSKITGIDIELLREEER